MSLLVALHCFLWIVNINYFICGYFWKKCNQKEIIFLNVHLSFSVWDIIAMQTSILGQEHSSFSKYLWRLTAVSWIICLEMYILIGQFHCVYGYCTLKTRSWKCFRDYWFPNWITDIIYNIAWPRNLSIILKITVKTKEVERR